MPSEQAMKAALQAYIDCFNAGDADGLIALYADDAVVEDPVGGAVYEGKEAIAEFYRYAVSTGAKLSLQAPIRASHGNAAAMAFTVDVVYEGKPARIHVIDVMTFDSAGKFSSMRAYWGKTDLEAR